MLRLGIAFFASGFAALVYQIVWQRMLGMFAGSDTVSAALVIGAFLLGLGVGSVVGASIADRLSIRGVLVAFAGCEVGIAAFALLSKVFLYDFLVGELATRVTGSVAVFGLCFAGLVLPTALMGASLPLLSRAAVDSLETAARRIGWLYGLNTLGAGVGAIAAGWLLIGEIGYVGTIQVAGACNILAAVLALMLARNAVAMSPVTAEPRAETAAPVPSTDGFGSLAFWSVLVFLSGYVIVALEIVWVRFLGQIGQYHAYLFATILGTFLIADGAGMAVASRIVGRSRDPRPVFFLLQSGSLLLASVLLLGLLWLLGMAPLDRILAADAGRFHGQALAIMVGLIVIVVAPPSFLIGMTFPYAQRAVQRDLASVGARVGWVQLANIAGNALGAILTGLATLHVMGTAGTIGLLVAISLGMVGAWLLLDRGTRTPVLRPALLALCIGLVALLPMIPGNAALWKILHQVGDGQKAYWSEDRSGVALFRADARQRGPFFIQGHTQSQVPFLPIHLFLGAVGPLLHADPADVLVIGVGSGGTPFGAGVSDATRRVTAIELIQLVYDVLGQTAAADPDGAIAAMLADKRYRLIHGDGRRALFRGDQLYDVVEADAILPESSHSGLLYSREFMVQVRGRLKPGGLFVQWAPTARVTHTFIDVFPHVVMLRPGSILIGSDRPIPYDALALRARLGSPATRAWLGRGGGEVSRMADIFSQPASIWTPGTPRMPADLLSDTFPRDEYFLNNPARAGSDVQPGK